ncbi:hypothetical protein [Actinosynnema sp. NPDC023587]|uniref:hypothetical protein n=1 Tax=Actinosynnema sp. NPDC023587 TaxID=3154695 RepID=UPI0033D97407
MFENRTFALANALIFLVCAALGGVVVLMARRLRASLGCSPPAAGPTGPPITSTVLAPAARPGRPAQRIGSKIQLFVGPLLVAVGMPLLRRAEPGAGCPDGVLPGVVVPGPAVVVARCGAGQPASSRRYAAGSTLPPDTTATVRAGQSSRAR